MLKKEAGFTLIEMMIVLMIISILLLIAVPNMVKNNSLVKEKTCESTIDLLQSQVEAYAMEHDGQMPQSLDVLKEQGYVDRVKCPDGDLTLEGGKVQKVSNAATQ
ncbi:MAG TPA: competence type IV pilus major pilin ComGC [Bacillales bacterium]